MSEPIDNPATPDVDLDAINDDGSPFVEPVDPSDPGAFVQENPPQRDDQPAGAEPTDQGEPVVDPEDPPADDAEAEEDEDTFDPSELPGGAPEETDDLDDSDTGADDADPGTATDDQPLGDPA